MLVRRIPTVLSTGLYAIPALVGAAVTVATVETGVYGLPAALGAATLCFLIRVLGLRYGLNAPEPPETRGRGGPDEAAWVSRSHGFVRPAHRERSVAHR